MIIFLYGPDTFRSQQKLKEIIEEYKKSRRPGLSFYWLNLENQNFSDFKEKINAVSMFKEKKIIILDKPFANKDFVEKFLDFSKKRDIFKSQEEILIIREGDLSEMISEKKPRELYEELIKSGTCQEFKLLAEPELKKWLKKEVEKRGVEIEPKALAKLVFYIGNDLWRMSNEINKLIAFKKTKKVIEETDIDLLVKPKIDPDIFRTITAVTNKNKKLALKLIQEHLEKGERPDYILGMILWQIRNLVQVKTYELKGQFYANYSYLDRQIINKVARDLKIHPYVAEKSLKQAKKFTIEELKKIYQKLLEVDLDIKTGRIEPEIALDLFITEI